MRASRGSWDLSAFALEPARTCLQADSLASPLAQGEDRFWRRDCDLERGTRFELATTCLEGRTTRDLFDSRTHPNHLLGRVSRVLSTGQEKYSPTPVITPDSSLLARPGFL